jgi:hypothetical protein
MNNYLAQMMEMYRRMPSMGSSRRMGSETADAYNQRRQADASNDMNRQMLGMGRVMRMEQEQQPEPDYFADDDMSAPKMDYVRPPMRQASSHHGRPPMNFLAMLERFRG